MNQHAVDSHGSPGVIYLQVPGAGGADTSVLLSALRYDDWTVVEVDGEMDVQVIPLLADLVASGDSRVVVDLHRVTFMDATYLGTVVETQGRDVAASGDVRLVASRSVRRLLTLAGCDRMFPAFDSVEQAVSTPSVGLDLA